jgi:DNA-binding Xre family transcriptional regulator
VKLCIALKCEPNQMITGWEKDGIWKILRK